MYREAIKQLELWKREANRRPMVLRGARQEGKTWIMKEFGKQYYEKCAYISMDENERMEEVFREAFDIDRIIEMLEIQVGFKIEPEKTLIIFDEVQEIPRALKSLKYFQENALQFHIIAAGSLLGIALHEGTLFPVGKVDFCNLYPLTFREFLLAFGEEKLIEVLDRNDVDIMQAFKTKYTDYLKYYYYVGGNAGGCIGFYYTQGLEKGKRSPKQVIISL